MAKKVLNTITNINESGNQIGLFTYYALKVIYVLIQPAIKVINGINFVENELEFTAVDYDDVNLYINNDGELIVRANNPDKFNINSEGQLTITE